MIAESDEVIYISRKDLRLEFCPVQKKFKANDNLVHVKLHKNVLFLLVIGKVHYVVKIYNKIVKIHSYRKTYVFFSSIY